MTLRNHQWLPVAVMALAGALLCHSAPPVHAQEATPEPDGASVVDVVAAFGK